MSTTENFSLSDSRFSKVYRNLISKVDTNDPGHDRTHIDRVIFNCLEIADGSEQVDFDLLLLAALMHDIVNLPKDHPDRAKASEMAAAKAKEYLVNYDFTDCEIEKVAQIIIEHSFSRGEKPSSIESEILQDADRLDALGAIGIMRWVTCGTKLNSQFYHAGDPLSEQRNLDDSKFMLDHYFQKLKKLPEMMNTRKGRELAKQRIQFMNSFVQNLLAEIRL